VLTTLSIACGKVVDGAWCNGSCKFELELGLGGRDLWRLRLGLGLGYRVCWDGFCVVAVVESGHGYGG
jgi:hypothetical protein